MKQFIKDNKPFSQTDREDLMNYYQNLGCIKVPVIYNDDFIKPLWNGTEFIESATPEEIAEANKLIVPQTISQLNFRIQLIEEDISIDSIYNAINSIADDKLRLIVLNKFDKAVYFNRNDETLNYMASQLGISQDKLDEIFINGNQL